MTDDEKSIDDDPKDSAPNKQMSPFASGALLGGMAFAFVFYRSHDLLRALLVGSVVFGMLFWVVFAGQYLDRRNKTKKEE